MKNGFRPKESRPQQPSVPPMPSIAQVQHTPRCKYLLPCGICDKTNEICSQYEYAGNKVGDIVKFGKDKYEIVGISDEPYVVFDDGSRHYALSLHKVGGDYHDWLYVNDAQINNQ